MNMGLKRLCLGIKINWNIYLIGNKNELKLINGKIN